MSDFSINQNMFTPQTTNASEVTNSEAKPMRPMISEFMAKLQGGAETEESEYQELGADFEDFDPANPAPPYDIDASGEGADAICDAAKKTLVDNQVDVSDDVLGLVRDSLSEVFDNLKGSAANPLEQSNMTADAPQLAADGATGAPDVDSQGSALTAISDKIVSILQENGVELTDTVMQSIYSSVEGVMNNLKGAEAHIE